MKMRFVFLMVCLLVTVAFTGCSRAVKGDGTISTESRTVSDFNSLEAEGGFSIGWTSAPEPSFSITTDQNLLEHVQSVVKDGTLRISTDERLASTKGIKILVSSSSLKSVDLTGAMQLTVKQVTGEQLSILSAGAVSVEASGAVDRLTVSLTGASHLLASFLSAKKAIVALTGASNAEVAVTEDLKVSITGAGSLAYTGSPRVDQNVTGVGRVHQRLSNGQSTPSKSAQP